MKIKHLAVWFLAAVLAVGCTGCQLARPDAESESAQQDRLIGVFVTKEYLDLFDFDSYFSDNMDDILNGGEISMEDSAAYEGRYYATRKENNDYVFDGLDGMGLYCYQYEDAVGSCTVSHADEGMTGNGVHYISTDEGDSVEMDGTIYVTAQSRTQMYANPVYQTASGEIYLTSEGGFMTDTADYEGEVYSTTLEDTVTVTESGETQTMGCKVTIRLSVMFAPTEIVVIQMDENSRELARNAYAPGAVPEALTLDEACAYVIAETHKQNGSGEAVTTYELFDPAEDNSLQTFRAREDGVCIRQDTELIFPGRDHL